MVRQHHHRSVHDKIFAKIAEMEIDVIDAYRHSAQSTLRNEERILQRSLESTRRKVQRGERSDEALEGIEGQLEVTHSIHGLSEELAVIALFRVVETSYGRVVRFVEGGEDIARWVSFKEAREKWARDSCGFEMSSTAHYDAIDQLRDLNNRIKHRQSVGVALSVRAAEQQQEARKACTDTYERVAVLVPDHIQDFAARVLATRQQATRR